MPRGLLVACGLNGLLAAAGAAWDTLDWPYGRSVALVVACAGVVAIATIVVADLLRVAARRAMPAPRRTVVPERVRTAVPPKHAERFWRETQTWR